MWYTGKITEIKEQSPTTKAFKIKVPEVEKIDFKAGQFSVMELPIHERRTKRRRSYSIANAPDGSNVLEFSVVKLEGGAGSTYLCDEAEVGTEIKLKSPGGMFYLPADTAKKNLVFICTGTGVAPFRSMIFDLLNHHKPFKSLHLIFGTRHESGILYRDEFEKLAEERADFSYDVVLSRENHRDFQHGYVHEIYEEKYRRPDKNTLFYLCGWSGMVDEAVKKLTEEIGFAKEQVIFELYG